MLNWQDPETLLLDSLAVVKIMHFIDGVYMYVLQQTPLSGLPSFVTSSNRWDWLMGLPYEYRLLTRKRQWQWPTLVSAMLVES
ncbi:hypothetical protein EIP86_003891 [Pleurotus ostreatoroseus]|nr:hypothetical protein EIP86_003891 [Pleurotus ostreatoroseus]